MNKKLIRKMLTAAGGPLQLTPEELKYLEWSKMTPLLKREYRNNRINAELQRGPNITNFWEAFQTYIGNRDPENPHLQTGDVPNPGMRNPKLIILGILKVKNITKSLWNNGKLILKNIPYNLENFYRGVDRKAILDAKKTKLIKGGKYFEEPYFGLGKAPWNKGYVIEGSLKSSLWVSPSSYYNYKREGIPINEYITKSAEGNSGSYPVEAFPWKNNSTLVSTEGFNYWKKYPIIGWRKHNFKQGGKMNILEFLKNGSGIHIKKKNRGKFTSYCGGKVTDECIRKAKASGNPTLVKRATFAANARKWKHKKGGKAFVNGVSVLDSNPNAYKLVKKKVKMRLYGGYLDTPIINYSPIVGRHLSWLQEASDYATKLENLKRELKLIELLLKLEQQNKITDNLFGLTNTILNSIGNKKSKTTIDNGSPVSGTSSLLTNIGNTGSLSSNLNPMNFFGL